MKQAIAGLTAGVKEIFLGIIFTLNIAAFGSEFNTENPSKTSNNKSTQTNFDELTHNVAHGKWHSTNHVQYKQVMWHKTITETLPQEKESFHGIAFDMPNRWYDCCGCFSNKCVLTFRRMKRITTKTTFAKLNNGEEEAISKRKFVSYYYLQLFDDNGEPLFVRNTSYIPRLDAAAEDTIKNLVFPKNATIQQAFYYM